jgi:hypothetical protein
MQTTIEEQFRGRLGRPWRRLQQGGGRLIVTEGGLRLATAGARRSAYSNAQIDDYSGLARRELPWRPPVHMQLRARFPARICGTAGFGFWNSPISPLGSLPSLPAAAWFFYASPPANMATAIGVPGQGWKAATIDMTTPAAWAWAPLAPLVMVLSRAPALYRRLWPRIQRALRIDEAPLGHPDAEWRDYSLEWRRDGARFAVDGRSVLETDRAPGGPLGFVAWIDTQWLIATPQGQFGWGLHEAPAPQYLDLAELRIEGAIAYV